MTYSGGSVYKSKREAKAVAKVTRKDGHRAYVTRAPAHFRKMGYMWAVHAQYKRKIGASKRQRSKRTRK